MRTRNRMLTLTAALAGTMLAGASQAADLPRKAPVAVVAAAPFNWSGFYVGGHFGAAWGTVESELPIYSFVLPVSSHTVNGFLGGAQVGFNWQLNSWLVLGAEGQFSWADVDGSTPCLVVVKCTSQVNWIATAAGRIGYTFDRTMLFAKVGVAWADSDYSATFGPFSATASDTRTGLMIGAGVEHAFLSNWSAKIEYNYMDFGTESLGFTSGGSGGCEMVAKASYSSEGGCHGSNTLNADITQRIHLIKFGLNYRFGGGAPAVTARY
jgi:outer membrane immunogenic protein